MKNPDSYHHSEEPSDQQIAPSKSFERYDVTGNRIGKWTLAARANLAAAVSQVFRFGKMASKIQLPGTNEELGEKVQNLPGKGVEFLEAQIDKAPIENQLKSAQTQTEFLRQELLREQIANTREDTRGKRLSNAERELELRERLLEITQGKTDVHLVTDGDNEIVIIGSLPNLTEFSSDASAVMIGELGLSTRTMNVLVNAGIESSSDLQDLGCTGILAIEGIGEKALAAIKTALAAHSIALGD